MEISEIRVNLTDLKPGPYQSRREFNPGELLELAESIGQQGVLNPPLVAPATGSGNGQGYVLLAGERRWRASCALAAMEAGMFAELPLAVDWAAATEAGQMTVRPELGGYQLPVRLVSGEEPELHAAAVVDNHQRVNLNPVEEAQDFLSLKERYGWSIWQTAKAVGKSDNHVRNRLRLLELEPEIQALIAARRFSKDGQVVEALLLVPDPAVRVKLAQRFAERNSSIKAIVAGCRRVVELMELAAKEPAAAPAPTTPIAAARVTVMPAPGNTNSWQGNTPPDPPLAGGEFAGAVCLCEECREQINRLAEELCGQCAAKGLSAQCLTCPGVIEFVERLVRLTQC
jgi:ParB family transcriptional regulator, chromosome partitioning protein